MLDYTIFLNFQEIYKKIIQKLDIYSFLSIFICKVDKQGAKK